MNDPKLIAGDLEDIIARARRALEALGPLPEADAEAPAVEKADPASWQGQCPPEFQWVDFADPATRKRLPWALEQVDELCALPEDGAGVTFMGAAGRGKSSLAAGVFRRSFRRGDRFAYAGDVAKMRQGWPLGEGEPPAFAKILKCRLLWLDDLGAESNDRDGCLADLIQTRHREQRFTLITTGLSYDGISKRYGSGIARRVFERQVLIDLGGA